MSIVEWCQRIQDTWASRVISESIWGYPTVGALHVLAIALFGGAVLLPHLRTELRWIRRIGVGLVVLTGIVLFASGAVRYYGSTSFRIKMVLLLLIVVNAIAAARHRRRSKLRFAIALVLWSAVIFAARGIAFF